jgi:EAL domain-containing protein (putative c-di-GMP-specific phosphodiesterase class I)
MTQRRAVGDRRLRHRPLVDLQQLPLDEIKVDSSFVKNLATVASDAAIARSTIDLAHNLELIVVAEGVEDTATLDRLLEYGCDLAQGYLFSRPLPADQLTEWLATSPYGIPAVTATTAPKQRPGAPDR